MKDPRQGAAAIVFLVFYVLAFAFTLYCLFTRRGKRYIFSAFLFNLLRIGANISSLGWAIHLYENFDWLVASLILGTEGEQLTLTGRKLTSRLLRTRTGHPVRIMCDDLPPLMIGSSSSGTRKRLSVLRCFTPTYLRDVTSVCTVSPMLPFGSSGVSKKSGYSTLELTIAGLIPANVMLIVGSKLRIFTTTCSPPLTKTRLDDHWRPGSSHSGRTRQSRIRLSNQDRPKPSNCRSMYLFCRHLRRLCHGRYHFPKSPKAQ